ncbi:MAG: hypothetical protein WHU94_10460 [Thermogemmata sp.]
MADALTHLITAALSRAAAHPGGLPLFPSRQGEGGLFPASKAGRTAAQKCLAENWLQLVPPSRAACAGTAASERYTLSDRGWQRLLQEAQPRQVLEDFLRVVEKRTALVAEWLSAAQRLQEELQELRQALNRWLAASAPPLPAQPSRNTPPPLDRGISSPERSVSLQEPPDSSGAATAEIAAAEAILHALAEWSRQGGADCPLPELFRAVSQRRALSIGLFHDALRRLQARQALALHPWTGPLYALPEPAYALLAGHGVAYYASLRPCTPTSAAARPIREAGNPPPVREAGNPPPAAVAGAAPLTSTLAPALAFPENQP